MTAPSASTTRTRFTPGMLPLASTSFASFARPTIVPMASKKMLSRMVKVNRTAAVPPRWPNAPNKLTLPTRLRSGTPTHDPAGSSGTTSDQPAGFSSWPGATLGPTSNTASSTTARAVAASTPMRMAPRTRRTTRAMVRMRPKTKTRVGQPMSTPPKPRPTGTVVFATSGTRRTKPALTRPIRAMNRPMPTTIAVLRLSGTALKTAVRKPVRTSTSMVSPASITRPMMSAHVRPGLVATVMATKALTPSPVASANGYLAQAPMTIVRMPATSAVTAATRSKPSSAPEESAPARMSGLSTTM